MKKIFLYYALILTVAGSSCHKDLEIPNPNRQGPEVFWTTAENAVAGVNAIYAAHRRTGTFARWNHFANIIRSDEGYSPSPWTDLANWNKFIIIDYNFVLSRDIYLNNYQGIFRVNQVLANVPNITMDETLKKRLLGEAKFNRALFYWNLVSLFGNVPVVTEPSRTGLEPIPYSTEQQVWAQMEKDLTEAAESLPEQYGVSNLGRATKGAAMALLGKSYLQQKKWQQAADAFKWLTDREGALYQLMPNFMDNFTHLNENNKESVFEIQFANQDGSYMNADDPNPELGSQRPRFFAPVGFRDAFAYRWLVNEFYKEKTVEGKRDPRLEVSLFFDSTDERGPNFTMVYGKTFTQRFGSDKEVWFKKFLNYYHENDEDWSSGINFRFIRYADVLLMYAEALNNLGKTAEAIPYVNKVRARSKMAPLATGMTQAQFQTQLEHERIVELTGEDVRWTDLSRWGYFDDDAKIAILKQRDPEFNSFIKGKSRLLPIPQIEIDLNTNLKQNPGW